MIPISKARHLAQALLCGSGLLLAGCTNADPFARPGAWHETDAPMHNIAVELVNPQDLHRGHGNPTLTGEIAVAAVGSAISSIRTGSASSGSASTAAISTGATGTSSLNVSAPSAISTP